MLIRKIFIFLRSIFRRLQKKIRNNVATKNKVSHSLFLVLQALKPFLLIRLGVLRSLRIGSLVGDTDRQIHYQSKRKRTLDIYLLESPDVASDYVLTLLRRRLNVSKSLVLAHAYNLFRGLSADDPKYSVHLTTTHELDVMKPLIGDRDPENVLEHSEPFLRLNKDEINMGEKFLASVGADQNKKIALLVGRDQSYGISRDDNPTYHAHRNMSINNFSDAAHYLVERGFHVFRMGSKVAEKLDCADEKSIFDYATNGMRTEFLDVFLASRSHLTISVGSGYDALPLSFRKPVLFVNYVPIGTYYSFRSNCLTICKTYRDATTKKILSLEEIFERGLFFDFDAHSYAPANVMLEDNSSNLIMQATIEMLDHVIDKNPWPSADEAIWDKFKTEFQKYAHQYPRKIHGELRARYATSGLKSGQFAHQ